MRATIREISSNLLILLSLIFLSVPSLAYPYEKIINFDSGVPSGVSLEGDTVRYVPTTLPSGTGNALQCTTGSGTRGMYCGLNIAPITPITNDVYVRYFARFLPDWNFGAGGSQFKAIIFNPQPHRNFMTLETGSNPNVGQLLMEDSSCATVNSGSPWYATRCVSTGFIPNDGSWHCIEAREYRNGANGRFQIWLDGVLVMDRNPIDLGSTPMTSIELGYQNSPSNTGGTMQYEDVVIADHYIGPNGAVSPSPSPPAPPVNLRVQ
jgi:hypothetical protein